MGIEWNICGAFFLSLLLGEPNFRKFRVNFEPFLLKILEKKLGFLCLRKIQPIFKTSLDAIKHVFTRSVHPKCSKI